MNYLLIALSTLLLTFYTKAKPTVISSIYPLQQIANAIVGEKTGLVSNSYLSPHDYAIKPSDAKLITQADIMLWIGSPMMPQLKQYIARRGEKITITAATLEDIHLIEGHEHHGHEHHGHEHHGHEQHGHEQQQKINYDPHLWLDIDNAAKIATALTNQLILLDKDNRSLYQKNLQLFLDDLDQTHSLIMGNFESIKLYDYFVFHDAYAYFEEEFGIAHSGTIKSHSGQIPKTQHLHHLKEKLNALPHACLFREPQFNSPIIQALGKGDNITISTLDPIGYEKTLSGGYPQILKNIANTLLTCKKP